MAIMKKKNEWPYDNLNFITTLALTVNICLQITDQNQTFFNKYPFKCTHTEHMIKVKIYFKKHVAKCMENLNISSSSDHWDGRPSSHEIHETLFFCLLNFF